MAAVITYEYPVGGTTVAPTQAQMALLSMLTAQVVFVVDTDTTAVITHNMGVSAANLGSLFPIVVITPNVLGTAPLFVVAALTNSNVVTLTKASGLGSNGTFSVTVMRPNSLME